MNIYDFLDYKEYIKAHVEGLPNQGRGEWGRLARAAGISSTLISQIFNGDRELSIEQGFLMVSYLNLNTQEWEYFELLILHRRAGVEQLKKLYLEKIIEIQKRNLSFKKEVSPKTLKIEPSLEVTYYTEWVHAAIRLLCEIDGFQTPESIAAKLSISLKQVKASAEFLNSLGLIKYKNGRLMGLSQNLHLEKNSPMTYLRQLTWRMKALENFHKSNLEDFTFNALLTIEKSQIEEVKKILNKALKSIGEKVESKNPEELMCLNVDFFNV